MPITITELLHIGLRAIGCPEKLLVRHVPLRKKIARYKANFGQLPRVHARVWNLLNDVEDERNFDRFFMLLFFYKTYPTEAVIVVRFGMDEETVRTWLWFYAEALALLKDDLIKMPETFADAVKLPVVIDGTQCMVFEPAHAFFPMDPAFFGHKRLTASYNDQMVLSSFESSLYGVHGPYPAGSHSDATMFVESGLQEILISQGKRAIDGTEGIIGPNRKYHSKQTNMYHRRQRARIERIMGYFTNYSILSGVFRIKKDRQARHKLVMDGIAVLVQVALQTTNPVFAA